MLDNGEEDQETYSSHITKKRAASVVYQNQMFKR